MTIVKYIGTRPYVEFQHEGSTYGFSRGMERDDIPHELAVQFKEPGFPQWDVQGLKSTPSNKEMLDVIEEEPEVVEEELPIEEEPEVEEIAFDPEWTRGEMMKWFRERGDTVARTVTRASLTARAEALSAEGDE